MIKKYKQFVKENYEEVVADAPSKPVVKPGIDTPTRTKPSRPGYIPTEKPSEKDKPLAKVEDPNYIDPADFPSEL